MPRVYQQDLYAPYWTVPVLQRAILNGVTLANTAPHVTAYTDWYAWKSLGYWEHIAYEANNHTHDNFVSNYEIFRALPGETKSYVSQKPRVKSVYTVTVAFSGWLLCPHVPAPGADQETDIIKFARTFLAANQ